ncbi:MAG TPA: ATP synthase F1 subunit gamma [Chloroflexota bacterium]|nr:ATP synthase F1 subunit gamma [Chloroflexota bacterium]
MASRREIRRRIRSVKNLAQITKAMQMVAASRMRRAQARVTASRPYAEAMRDVVAQLGARSGAREHPVLKEREVRTVELVTITPDRGLAGALVTNINRASARFVDGQTVPVRVVVVGRKGRTFAARAGFDLVAAFQDLGDSPTLAEVGPIAHQVLDDFSNGVVDRVNLAFTRFHSTLRQTPEIIQLLPAQPPELPAGASPWNFEPDEPDAVLDVLLPRYVESVIFQAMLEAKASEQSARMVAMSNATDNANEMVGDLTLDMNKARQAEITKEIAEIATAAGAVTSR